MIKIYLSWKKGKGKAEMSNTVQERIIFIIDNVVREGNKEKV